MTYYRTCPICGANLDPDEHCSDCDETQKSPSSAGTE